MPVLGPDGKMKEPERLKDGEAKSHRFCILHKRTGSFVLPCVLQCRLLHQPWPTFCQLLHGSLVHLMFGIVNAPSWTYKLFRLQNA
ncbi:hypothetical protein OPV22_000515 [Ensete ventricosum]|uniref:Uncharacterized protein n=1 Tax=Ensete ventricosum TaxID=4639 RepID=A0AAV8Q9J9_ENSVE|nr:hypothetical protein OPV22_000515 [Ensete ventricosum]